MAHSHPVGAGSVNDRLYTIPDALSEAERRQQADETDVADRIRKAAESCPFDLAARADARPSTWSAEVVE
jgi:hypothetical protein